MDLNELKELGLFLHFSGEGVDHSFLTEQEAELISNRHASYRQNFIRGRICAKRALESMGFRIDDLELLRLPDGQVSWPEGVVGSISHTDGFAGAIVGWKSDFQSVGLDIEKKNRVHPSIWDRVFTENEKENLLQYSKELHAEKATEIFSMKEAFYKFQWPLTNRFLGMRDVEWDELSGKIRPILHSFFEHNCKFLMNDEHIISIIYL